MPKKSIIFICQRFPYPPDRGDRIITWNIIRHLSSRYDIHLFCLTSDKRDLGKAAFLSPHCKDVYIFYKPAWRSCLDAGLALLFSRRPLSCAYYFSRKMKSKIAKLAGERDIPLAYTFSSNVFFHVYGVERVKKVLHLCDVDSEKWAALASYSSFFMRPVYQLEASRLRTWELECDRTSDLTILCSTQEMALFRSIGAKGKAVVMENGVDVSYYSGADSTIQKEPAIVFTGVMDYLPNVDAVLYFFKEVFPFIKEAQPNTRLYIVGQNPTGRIRQLADKDPHCIVTGYVDDVRPFMERSMVFVAPLRIVRGIPTKVLEALAMELPVVSTTNVSDILRLGESQGVIAVNDPGEMGKAIVRLLEDPSGCERLGKAGRRAVAETYSWDRLSRTMDAALDSII